MAPQQPSPVAAAEADKYMLVGLDGVLFAIQLLQLCEIIAGFEVAPMPNLPPCFRGVVHVRETVLPVLDLRRRFGLSEKPYERRSRLLVVDRQPSRIAVLVDEVTRVVTLHAAQISEAPVLTSGARVPCVSGVSFVQDKLVVHLDLLQLVTTEDEIQITRLLDELSHSAAGSGRDVRSQLPASETGACDVGR